VHRILNESALVEKGPFSMRITVKTDDALPLPHVLWASEPVEPGQVVMVHGGNFGGGNASTDAAAVAAAGRDVACAPSTTLLLHPSAINGSACPPAPGGALGGVKAMGGRVIKCPPPSARAQLRLL
jgi:hypothetical protein